MCLTEGSQSLGRPAVRVFYNSTDFLFSSSLPKSLPFHSISPLSFLTSNVTWSSALTTVISRPWGSVFSNCQSNINSCVVWMWDGLWRQSSLFKQLALRWRFSGQLLGGRASWQKWGSLLKRLELYSLALLSVDDIFLLRCDMCAYLWETMHFDICIFWIKTKSK